MPKQIQSLDDANEAVLDNDQALRVQPPAPGATTYYFTENGKWKRQKAGHSTATSIDVENVRETVKRAIQRNESSAVNVLRAVDKERVEEYA